ncbi:MAG: hypothetical protein O7C75_21720 [Verrucomicrobia bacterium]|nr:hypothetical protein [Verrucomicrobiota bacterium]
MTSSIYGTILLIVLVSGCTTPQTQDGEEKELASALGIEKSDVRYLSYGKFVKIPDGSKEIIQFTDGVVLLTETDLHLFKGGLESSPTEDEVRIPIADMNGVNLIYRKLTKTYQLQIKQQDRLIVLNAREDKRVNENESIRKLHSMILASDVAAWPSTEYYVEGNTAGDVVEAVVIYAAAWAFGEAVMNELIKLLFLP